MQFKRLRPQVLARFRTKFSERSEWMRLSRSIVCGVAGPCKTESSQKPVAAHPLMIKKTEQQSSICLLGNYISIGCISCNKHYH